MSRKHLDVNKIKELHSKGLNDNEIARELGASVNGIRYVRKDKLNLSHNIKTYTITKEMDEIIIGTLLGDAWLGYVYKGCTAPKYQVVHCLKQKTYALTIYDKLRPLMTDNICHTKGKPGVIRGKKCNKQDTIMITSHNIKELIIYRKMFYPNGIKIIPVEFIKDKFTAISLAYWFMDDGSVDNNSNSYIFNTQCFSRENLTEFITFLKERFNLEFTIKKDCSLYLRHKSNEIFKSLVKTYLTEDMKYKLGRH